VPEALVDSEQWAETQNFATQIPMLFHWGMLEVRLGAGRFPVDVLGALLQLHDTRKKIHEALLGDQRSVIESAAPTLRGWASGDRDGFSRTPNLWLEWDRDGENNPLLPWLCIAPHFFDPSQERPNPQQLGELASDFMRSDPRLQVDGAAEHLVEIASRVPQGGQLMGFASLNPRGRAVCRVFARLPHGGTKEWLKAIGWPGDISLIDSTHDIFHVVGEEEWCQIEFDRKVRPHVALELAQTERGFPRREARERWLQEAVRAGWATEEKAQAVMDWQGHTPVTLPSGDMTHLLRSFHLKLSTGSSGTQRIAKAYLGFYFRRRKVVPRIVEASA
jgi:hypothetical protein